MSSSSAWRPRWPPQSGHQSNTNACTATSGVRRFPYGVFYVIENNTLVVLAIFHCAREPIIWKSR